MSECHRSGALRCSIIVATVVALVGLGRPSILMISIGFVQKVATLEKKKGVGSRVVVLDQSPAVAGKAQVIFGDLVCWFMNGLFRAMSNSEFVLRSLVKFRKAFHEPEMHPCSYLKSKPRMQSEFPFALCLGWGETRPHHNEDEEHQEEEEEEEEEDGVWR